MIFLGFSFFGDSTTVLPTPTNVSNIDYVELENGFYDDLFITKDADDTSPEINPNWTHDTVLYADFEGDTMAGNVDWTVDNTSALLIKRREANSLDWMTIYEKPVSSIDDFNIDYIDAYARANTEYEYAVVPVLGNIEGNYSTNKVLSDFGGIYLIEKDIIYGTFLSDDFVDTVRNVPSTTLSLPGRRYAVYCSNSIANYDTGSCSGTFVRLDERTCDFDFEHIHEETEKVMERLSNRKPKILKVYDGRMWLIMVTGNPTDSGETNIYNRKISFEWAEIGDVTSEKDLYYANLSDVPSQWWNV